MPQPLWTPSPDRIEAAAVTRFAIEADKRFGHPLPDYAALHSWSVERPDQFWDLMWDWAEIRGHKGAKVVENVNRMPGATWFPEARLNFAENLLRRRDDADALVFWG